MQVCAARVGHALPRSVPAHAGPGATGCQPGRIADRDNPVPRTGRVESRLLEFPLPDRGRRCAQAIGDFKFAAAVVAYGMFLRDSPHKGAGQVAAFDRTAGPAAETQIQKPGKPSVDGISGGREFGMPKFGFRLYFPI